MTTARSAAAPDATALANKVKAGVTSVSKVVTVTEDNDPNKKIGRPGGYVSAAVLYDSGVTCTATGFGSACGAIIEVWPTEQDAKDRSAYIAKVLKASPALGTEYDFLQGPALLRVTGAVKPSTSKQYEAAFAH